MINNGNEQLVHWFSRIHEQRLTSRVKYKEPGVADEFVVEQQLKTVTVIWQVLTV